VHPGNFQKAADPGDLGDGRPLVGSRSSPGADAKFEMCIVFNVSLSQI